MDSPLWIYCIGLVAQLFFTMRVLVQWVASEKSKKVESPSSFWLLSIAGSAVFMFYGYLRKDLSITLGEFLSFYIYFWNIRALGLFQKTNRAIPWLVAIIPLFALGLILADFSSFKADFLPNENMPLGLLISVSSVSSPTRCVLWCSGRTASAGANRCSRCRSGPLPSQAR